MTETKRCNGCSNDVPLEDFYRASKGGLMSKCKRCICHKVRDRRQRDPRVQAYDRARGPRVRPGYIAEWRARNPEKYRAQTAVGNAIRDGRLKKGPCAVCGETEGVHAHHHDYSKKLDVIWMCPLHHPAASWPRYDDLVLIDSPTKSRHKQRHRRLICRCFPDFFLILLLFHQAITVLTTRSEITWQALITCAVA